MKDLKNKLMTIGAALLLVVSMSSFQSVEVEEDVAVAARNGEYISAGDELINGVWYSVRQCVAGNRVKCVIGSKIYKKKRNQIAVDDPVVVTRAITNIFLNSISL
jgi:hypothetical protein